MNVEDVKKVAVFGAGLMGNGIAQVCAQAGLNVAMVDIEDRFVENGMKAITKNLQRGVDKGRMTPDQMQELRSYSTRARITRTTFVNDYSWGDFKDGYSIFG